MAQLGEIIHKVNGYEIHTIGGFITVRHWSIFDEDGNFMGTYFTYKEAKGACIAEDFDDAFYGKMYA